MLSDAPIDLPVRPVVPAVLAALRATGTAVLVAPPGSGKTTLVPLAVAEEVSGRVLVAQPRPGGRPRRRAGWPHYSTNGWASGSGTPCVATAESARAPGSRW